MVLPSELDKKGLKWPNVLSFPLWKSFTWDIFIGVSFLWLKDEHGQKRPFSLHEVKAPVRCTLWLLHASSCYCFPNVLFENKDGMAAIGQLDIQIFHIAIRMPFVRSGRSIRFKLLFGVVLWSGQCATQ